MIPISLVFNVILSSVPISSPSLVASIGSAEFRHPCDARLLGTSSDGKRLYTTQPAPYARGPVNLFVWESATGRLIAQFPLGLENEHVLHIGFGADGVRVFSHVGDPLLRQLRVVNPDTGEIIRRNKTWENPSYSQNEAGQGNFWHDLSPDGSWMIRPGKENQCRVFNTASGEESLITLRESSTIYVDSQYGFAPNSRYLYTGDKSGILVHDLAEGRQIAEIPNPGDEQHGAGFTPDGKQLFLWIKRSEAWSLEVWEIATKKRRSVLAGRSLAGRIHFTPHGKHFVIIPGSPGSNVTVGDWEVYDTATGEGLSRIPAGNTSSIIFSPDGRTLYTQPGLRTIVPWDVATGRVTVVAPRPAGPVNHFRFMTNGQIVGQVEGFIYTWDPLTGKELSRTQVPRDIDWNGAVAFNPSGDRFHFTEFGNRIVDWDIRTGDERRSPLPLERFPNAIVNQWFTPDGSRHVESRVAEALLILRDPATGKETARFRAPEEWHSQEIRIRGFAHSRDHRRIAIIGIRKISLREIAKGIAPKRQSFIAFLSRDGSPVPRIITVDTSLNLFVFSPDGRYLVICDQGFPGKIDVRNSATGRQIATYQSESPGYVNDVLFSPDGRILAVSHGRQGIELVETVTWKVRGVAPTREAGWEWWGKSRQRDMLAWSADSRLLAAATLEGGLKIWDVRKTAGSADISDPVTPDCAWTTLAGDAKLSVIPIKMMSMRPELSVPFLKSKIPPAPACDAAKIRAIIEVLGNKDFQTREKATEQLNKLGLLAEDALRKSVKTSSSAEVVQRCQDLLNRIAANRPTSDEVRELRALEAMEWAGTAEAVKLIEIWSGGADGARLTTAAKEALGRLKKK